MLIMSDHKLPKKLNSLEVRKRKVNAILKYQCKMLRVDAEHYNYDTEETIVENKNHEIDNNNATDTTRCPSGSSLQSSANSSEIIDDTDESNYYENVNAFSNINQQQNKVNIKRDEKVSKMELTKYLRSAKFGENSVVPSDNHSIILLPPPLVINQNRKSQQFKAQASDDVLTAVSIQDIPPGDVVFTRTSETKKITQSSSIDDVLTSDGIQDIPLGDVVFTRTSETKKITQSSSIDDVLTSDGIQDIPPGDEVFSPEPEINTTWATFSDVIHEPKAHHSRDISCTEIVTNNVDQSALFQQPQVYTSLKTVVFEHEPKDIEERKSSPSIIDVLDTSFFDPTTDPNNHVMISEQPKLNKKYRKKILKSYVDYLSDNEDFSAGSSDLWSMNESDSSINSDKKKKKCTKKKQKIIAENNKTVTSENLIKRKTKKENKSKLRRKLKDTGKSYERRSGCMVEEKTMKGNPCLLGVCARKCYEISEDRRISLFNYFWSLDIQRRKDWIVRCVQPISIKRKKTKSVESRRGQTFEYVINEGEGSRPVCQKFLINTLDITQKFILYTVKNSQENMASVEKRTCHAYKYSDEDKAYAKTFIESLPAVPSHYCRSKSSCLYLPQEFKNATNLFRIYLQDCQNNNKVHLSEKIFIKLFNEDYNIRFHIPKKDKCVMCTKAENTELLSEQEIKDMTVHLEEKKASYQRFKIHQQLTSNDTLTVSFDLQKVLNTPHGESMLLYYSRKYAVYNCTFYESQTKKGHCYVWGESDGQRGGNEIATCIYKFLLEIDKRPIKNVLLYCDSCPGQNKNKIVLTALHYFIQHSKNIQVVQINYLYPGHTYMPVDSMHAVIEREVRRIIVWSPSQWPTYMESARKNPDPYKINVLDYSDFINWNSLVSQKFTSNSQKQIQLKLMRIVTFKKKNTKSMEVKYSMNDKEEAQVVTFECKERGSKGKGKGKKGKNQDLKGVENVEAGLQKLYDKPNPITVAKYNDLNRLCTNGTIPKRFHKEYFELPSLGTVKDILPETDEEDDIEF